MVHDSVRRLDSRELRNPLVIAGFASASGVTANVAVQHLADRWDAQPFAEIDPEPYFDFTVRRPLVRLEDGERVIDWPMTHVYVASPAGLDRDVMLIAGVEPSLRWRTYSEAIASLLTEAGATSFVTVAAYPGAVPHTRPLPVRLDGVASELTRAFAIEPSASNYEGPVGITSVVSMYLRAQGLETVGLMALTPFYAVANPHPHATIALIDAVDRALGTSTPVTELRELAAQLDRDVATAIEESPQLKTVVTTLEEQFDWIRGSKTSLLSAPTQPLALPPSDEVIADVERFLEEQRGGRSEMGGKSA